MAQSSLVLCTNLCEKGPDRVGVSGVGSDPVVLRNLLASKRSRSPALPLIFPFLLLPSAPPDFHQFSLPILFQQSRVAGRALWYRLSDF